MEKVTLTLDNFEHLKVKLWPYSQGWAAGKLVAKGYKLQAWGRDQTVVTMQIHQTFTTRNYNSLVDAKLYAWRYHATIQKNGHTCQLPVNHLPIEF